MVDMPVEVEVYHHHGLLLDSRMGVILHHIVIGVELTHVQLSLEELHMAEEAEVLSHHYMVEVALELLHNLVLIENYHLVLHSLVSVVQSYLCHEQICHSFDQCPDHNQTHFVQDVLHQKAQSPHQHCGKVDTMFYHLNY
jgi:hypothetical protein